jgi:hypothetical protein
MDKGRTYAGEEEWVLGRFVYIPLCATAWNIWWAWLKMYLINSLVRAKPMAARQAPSEFCSISFEEEPRRSNTEVSFCFNGSFVLFYSTGD